MKLAVLPLVVLGLLLGAGALASPVGAEPGRAKLGRSAEPRLVYRFAAGSPLFAEPGLGRDGSVYVGAGDGYLHALGPDGSYRWSYTVKGRIVAAPIEDASTGRVFVATSEARLYAFEPDGRLRWVFPLPAAPQSELGLSPKGTLYFVGRDEHLYGVTTSGALVLRLAAPGPRSAPGILADGRPALILKDTIATLKGYGFERAPLPRAFAPGASLILAAERSIFACEDGHSRALGPTGAELFAPTRAGDCVAPPVPAGGFFAVAEASGDVRLVYPSGASSLVPLGALPRRPVWDGARQRLILSTAAGSITVLELVQPARAL